jgi:hypothetical protein
VKASRGTPLDQSHARLHCSYIYIRKSVIFEGNKKITT